MRDVMSLLDLSAAERQHNRILRLSFPEGDGPNTILLVNTLEASEGLSRPFEYTLELLSDDAHIHLKDLQGKMLCVELVRADGSLRYFTGRVFRFGLERVDGGLAYYEARVTRILLQDAVRNLAFRIACYQPNHSTDQPATSAFHH